VLSYVVPLRRWQAAPIDDLAGYLAEVAASAEVIVADGSAPDVFAGHAAALSGRGVRHLAVGPSAPGRNGKVDGVLAGVAAAGHEAVVIADDDVRYRPEQLERLEHLLGSAALVRPQNHFEPRPWHARWDTARTLLNRAFAADYPGTLGVRRSVLVAAGGYDAEVLFENLELIRTVEAVGGSVLDAPDLYVRRLPPDARHFLAQRVRQAYDSLATPGRFAAELALLPTTALLVQTGRWRVVALGAALTVAWAERGRRRAGGRVHFPLTSSLLAPGWLAERAVCSWLALAVRARHGGVGYAGTRFRRAATPRRQLRRRLAPRAAVSGMAVAS
jgi:hypothetical protein